MTRQSDNWSAGAETIETDRAEPEPGRLERFRGALSSGVLAGLGGGIVLWSGLRALRRGRRGRGILGLLAGTFLITVGARQRQAARRGPATDLGQQDVGNTSPDVDEAGLEGPGGPDSGEAVAASSVEIEDVSEGVDEASDATDVTGGTTDATDAMDETADSAEETTDETTAGGSDDRVDFESVANAPDERIGEGTYDERRGVPVPEAAFDEGFLETDDEVYWGIRESDDAVFLSRYQVVFEDGEGIEYVTTSAVDDEQLLDVPDAVLDHWAGVAGEEPMTDADVLVFATADDLQEQDVLWVVPEYVADVLFEE